MSRGYPVAHTLLLTIRQLRFAVQHKNQQFRCDRRRTWRESARSARSTRTWTRACCTRASAAAGAALSGGSDGDIRRIISTTAGRAGTGARSGWWRRRCAATTDISSTAHQRDILFSIERVCDRRSHTAAKAGRDVQQFLAFIRAVCDEFSVRQHLKHKIACRRDSAAADAATSIAAPSLFLRDWIPCDKRSTLAFLRRGADCGEI